MRTAPDRLNDFSLTRHALLVIAALAAIGLALRIWFLLAVTKDTSLVGDGLEFHGLANAIADGRGFVSPFTLPGHDPVPTAHKPPLLPAARARVDVRGQGGGLCGAPGRLRRGGHRHGGCRHHRQSPRRPARGRARGRDRALYPVFLVADASLRSETLFALCVSLALLAALRAWELPSPWRLCQLGFVIGLAALTRSEGLALLVLLAAPVVWRRGGTGRAWKLALTAAICGLTLAPWLIRCWIVFDEPVAITTSYGDLIAGANCDATYSGSSLGGWVFKCAIGESGGNEAQIARKLRARGVRYARDHADRLPVVVAARLLRPWGL